MPIKLCTTLSVVFPLLLLFAFCTISDGSGFTVTRYSLNFDTLPETFDGYKIAHLSDLHSASFGDDNSKLISAILSEEPDIIVMTGDMTDRRYDDGEVLYNLVSSLSNIAPVYYVTGNHEAADPNCSDIVKSVANNGGVVLDECSSPIYKGGSNVYISGVRDRGGTFLPAAEGSFNILLSHRPQLDGEYFNSGFDLVLSGHVHGGQVRLPLIGGLYGPNQGLLPKYDAGIYADGGRAMVVSRGLGNSGPFPRINNDPELVIVILKSGGGDFCAK